MSTQTFISTETIPLRRANDFLVNPKRFRYPEMLFDEFWREGELALLFGPSAAGKSLLAVQLADALSRGGGLHGFRMLAGRRRVLYVDLRHTDDQFRMRCSYRQPGPTHRFPRNMFRDRPPAGADLCEWLRAFVMQHRPQVVIIDDLTVVKNTRDGTRETLRLMRRLRQLREELSISILVLTDSREPRAGNVIGESDLGPARVLCTAADSVFAAGRSLKTVDDHYLIQTRARSARPYWTSRNAPYALIGRTDTGLLRFEFDERFSPEIDPDRLRLICDIARLAEREGQTFREIGMRFGISTSWAYKLYRKWTPAMDSALEDLQSSAGHQLEEDEWDEAGEFEYEDERDLVPANHSGLDSEVGKNHHAEEASGPRFARLAPWRADGDYSHIPFMASRRRRSVYDLERDINGYGREIWVESRYPTGKPIIFYEFDDKGNKIRRIHSTWGHDVKNLGPGPYLK